MKYPDAPKAERPTTNADIRKAMIPIVEQFKASLADITKQGEEQRSQIETLLHETFEAIKANKPEFDTSTLEKKLEQLIEKDTSVTIQPTEITVPTVDLSGIEKAIQSIDVKPSQPFFIEEFQPYTKDEDDTYWAFYAYIRYDGAYYIAQETLKTGTLLMFFGKGDVDEAFTNRKELKYQRFDLAVKAVYET